MDFDRLVNVDDLLCLMLVAGSPGFVGLIPEQYAGNVNLFPPCELLGNPCLLTDFFLETAKSIHKVPRLITPPLSNNNN